ncbi:MAG: hypothetical protein B7Z73_02610 [Planctomycetia bacterium 21-64-5]|nr:MAG: hypothetical protein B7Z73_02610 [Planctomycetia bacterium 21-64-5]
MPVFHGLDRVTYQTIDAHPLTFSDAIYFNGNLVSSSDPASATNDQFTGPAFTPYVSGTYRVVVTATDTTSGLSTSQTGDVVVNDLPPFNASIDMASSSQLGQPVTASVSYPINLPAVRAGETYTNSWTVSQHGSVVASGTSGTSNSFTFTPATAGDYNVAVVVADNYGGSTTASQTLSVVDPTAGLTFSSGGSVAQFKTATVLFTGGGSGLTYSYDLLDNGRFEAITTSSSASNVYLTPGSYTVHGRVSAPGGVYTDYYTTVTVTDVAPTITNLTLRSNGTLGGSIAAGLDYKTKNKVTVSWTVSPDTFAQFSEEGNLVEFVPQKSDVYTVTAQVSDPYGGTATMTKSVIVSAPNAPAALDNDGPDAQTSAATVFFTGGSTGSTYSFDFLNDGTFSDPGDVANSSTAFASYQFATPGVHTVHGQIKSATGTVTDYHTTVTVQDVPPANVDISMPANVYLGQGVTAGASYDNPAGNNETVAWTVASANGTQVAAGSGASFTFVPTIAGTYTVGAVVSDSYGGSADQSATLIVTDPTAGLTFSNGGPVNEGSSATVTFAGGDPNAGLTYSYDFLNDGTFTDQGDTANSPTATASHTFAQEGPYVVHGRVNAPGNVHTDYYTTLTVLDPAVQVKAVAVQGKEGAATGLVPVATFTDPARAEKISDYSATIDWGDGNSTTGTVVADGGGFSVEGNHTYADAGSYALNVTVNHDQAPAAAAQATATIAVVPITVSNLADDNAPATPSGSGSLTLRDAVDMFNAKGGTNEIDLSAGTYALTQSASPAAPAGT